MCGITGYIDFTKKTDRETLSSMVSCMQHRGPDCQGTDFFNLSEASIGLGHARLSIIDLSPAGRQPMHHQHLSIVFNGEVYNFREIRSELEDKGHCFKTNTDTEVLLHAYKEWSIKAVDHFIGMFSIAILDRDKQELILLRDRPGVKPMYYYWYNNLFMFASELKSFHEHPLFQKQINTRALGLYFDSGYIPAPHTIFKNCFKLKPGHFLKLNLPNKTIFVESYWDVCDFYTRPKQIVPYEEALEQVHSLLISSCEYRMVADVPVGVFLSGGYDSSAVTAILQANRSEKLKTFTIGFEEGNNEAPFARETANYLGTDHTEYICTTKEAQEIIPTLPWFYDEPFADSSAIPTMLVSKMAREKVAVALSADGGDELFSGYGKYRTQEHHLAALNRIPDYLKNTVQPALHGILTCLPQSMVVQKHKLAGCIASLDRDKFRQAMRLHRAMKTLPKLYRNNMFVSEIIHSIHNEVNPDRFCHETELTMATDFMDYLPNDILTKVDRATMSVSLEGREPLLDHRLIEYVTTLPFEFKYDGKTEKRILKDIVHTYLPKEIMDRPKAGFSVPIYSWLREDLAYLLDEYLSVSALNTSGLFNSSFLVAQIDLFRKKKLHFTPFIWKLLIFQMWYKRWFV